MFVHAMARGVSCIPKPVRARLATRAPSISNRRQCLALLPTHHWAHPHMVGHLPFREVFLACAMKPVGGAVFSAWPLRYGGIQLKAGSSPPTLAPERPCANSHTTLNSITQISSGSANSSAPISKLRLQSHQNPCLACTLLWLALQLSTIANGHRR